MRFLLVLFISLGATVMLSNSADAHAAFKKALSKKYSGMKVSCNACHVARKPKSERNEFGKLFFKEFKDQDLTAKFKEKKGEERKKFAKEVMIPAFNKALEKVKKLKKKDTETTYDELIKSEKIDGITKKKEKPKDG